MSELFDRLADLTAHRDRDVLDAALVAALNELLAPLLVAVHRSVGEEGAERWLTRARMADGDVAPSTDGAWDDIERLPRVEARPSWLDCLRATQPLVFDGEPATTLFPLIADSGTSGVLELRSARALVPSERRSVASILRLYRNFQGLLDYSERDTLTGLLNRKTFDDAFQKLALPGALAVPASEAGRRNDPAGGRYFLGVIDIDHFKRVNDSFGHLIGDEVLLLLSRLMRGTFRYQDRLYRFGGEEFVVLMRCADDDSAAIAFERLRSNVEQYAFPQVGKITISVGSTVVSATDTPASAFERADRAVYFAKGNGRNQVHSHAALVAAGLLDTPPPAGDVQLF